MMKLLFRRRLFGKRTSSLCSSDDPKASSLPVNNTEHVAPPKAPTTPECEFYRLDGFRQSASDEHNELEGGETDASDSLPSERKTHAVNSRNDCPSAENAIGENRSTNFRALVSPRILTERERNAVSLPVFGLDSLYSESDTSLSQTDFPLREINTRPIAPSPPATPRKDSSISPTSRNSRRCSLPPRPHANVPLVTETKTTVLPPALLKEAKKTAELAIKNHRIFSILGPYHAVRMALRSRGWVESFEPILSGNQSQDERSRSTVKRNKHQLSPSLDRCPTDRKLVSKPIYIDDEDSDNPICPSAADPTCTVPPWQEKDGYYAILSRLVRSAYPSFIWSLKKSQVDFRFLRKDQIINHHCRAPFTTKVGLCFWLRQLRWFDDRDASEFFPRCYILADDEDKQAFVDDFRLTACISLLKMVSQLHDQFEHDETNFLKNPSSELSEQRSCTTSLSSGDLFQPLHSTRDIKLEPVPKSSDTTSEHLDDRINFPSYVPEQTDDLPPIVLEMAIARCQQFLRAAAHMDIDLPQAELDEKLWPWDRFLTWYYEARNNPKMILHLGGYAKICHKLCCCLRKLHPQYDLDGTSNIWILKPGAKSRGRGIICSNRLDEVLRISQGSLNCGDSRFVAQKYLETPLLLYKTKFDIRQWFLVTDWSPLTVWWYNECYLRFCSQEFTLDDFSEAIHLSNNSIQHKYTNGPRSENLPEENMWTLGQFQTWLKNQGQEDTWDSQIQPAMKRAIIGALLCVQDGMDVRKNCFALYGADFMLTEDFKLWLLEINSSPCMAPSTTVTAKLTTSVLEDTIKVVLDRRLDRNCETGHFELIYRQALHNPLVYTGLDLRVEGVQLPVPRSNDGQQVPKISQNLVENHVENREVLKKSHSLASVSRQCVPPTATQSEPSKNKTDSTINLFTAQLQADGSLPIKITSPNNRIDALPPSSEKRLSSNSVFHCRKEKKPMKARANTIRPRFSGKRMKTKRFPQHTPTIIKTDLKAVASLAEEKRVVSADQTSDEKPPLAKGDVAPPFSRPASGGNDPRRCNIWSSSSLSRGHISRKQSKMVPTDVRTEQYSGARHYAIHRRQIFCKTDLSKNHATDKAEAKVWPSAPQKRGSLSHLGATQSRVWKPTVKINRSASPISKPLKLAIISFTKQEGKPSPGFPNHERNATLDRMMKKAHKRVVTKHNLSNTTDNASCSEIITPEKSTNFERNSEDAVLLGLAKRILQEASLRVSSCDIFEVKGMRLSSRPTMKTGFETKTTEEETDLEAYQKLKSTSAGTQNLLSLEKEKSATPI
ncbi:tubulin monoglycylase TTLL3 [Clonorchis sinensis]|uniref:Tubulin monoglycylase TTLL3 n=1 Tax=Clonorchis sinensis TaxID=79923 RepID=G7YJL9_CLOSI|nr:tubulin monoglycylase TTLL3 [Clonorchis sinensis]